MNGKLKDWSFSRTGESVLTITTRESCKKLWDALGDQEITFSIKRRVIPPKSQREQLRMVAD